MIAAVLALAISPVLNGGAKRTPSICLGWFQSTQVQNVRQKTKCVRTFHTLDIFKKDKIPAMVAVKSFHSVNIVPRMRRFEKYPRRALPQRDEKHYISQPRPSPDPFLVLNVVPR